MRSFAALLVGASLLATSCSQEVNDHLVIVSGATIYTADDQQIVESFAYDTTTGLIVAVGTLDDVRSEASGARQEVLDGGIVMPGLIDSHVHVPEAGLNLTTCFFEGTNSAQWEEEAAYCAEESTDGWIRGAGLPLYDVRNDVAAGGESPLVWLDAATGDMPAVILDDIGHAALANSAALELAGIGADAIDPQGGVYHRTADGELTGILLENAQQDVRSLAKQTPEENLTGLVDSLGPLAEAGVTAVADAGGYWKLDHPQAWYDAAADGSLTVRGFNTLYLYPDNAYQEQIDELAMIIETSKASPDRDMVRFEGVKIYIDGILDLGTALMHEPYDVAPDPGYPDGFKYFNDEQLFGYVTDLHDMGFQANFHAVGDRAATLALDAIEQAGDPADIAARNHRLTHIYLLDESDHARFGEIGVVADFQAGEATLDPLYHEDLTEIIGDRGYAVVPIDEVFAAGGTITLSTDWDADPMTPIKTIARAIEHSEISTADAIDMMTINAANSLNAGDIIGSIEVGKYADFVVFNNDITELAPPAIGNATVVQTVLAGETIYQAS